MGYSDLHLRWGGVSVSAVQEEGAGLHQSQPPALWQWMVRITDVILIIINGVV